MGDMLMFGFRIIALLSMCCVSSQSLADEPDKQTHDGLQLGDFLIKPEAQISGVYDDNIFATRTQKQADHILILSPSVSIDSDWVRHELQFFGSADIGRYQDYDTEDYDDFTIGSSGRFDLSDKNNVFGGLSYQQQHESRASPDSFFGRYPTEYSSAQAHLGTVRQYGNMGLRLGGTVEQLDFDDVPTDAAILNNDDRDRDIYGLGLRLSYTKNRAFTPFTQLIYDRRTYQDQRDDNQFERDSDGYRLAAGFNASFSQTLKSEFYLGHIWQQYQDQRFSDLSKPDFGATLRWLSSPSTLISANIERAVTETTLLGASGAMETSYSAQLKHRLLPQLTLQSHLAFSRYDYQGINRDDDYLEAGFGLSYDISPNLFLSADYRYLKRDSNLDFERLENSLDYDSHQLFLTLNARLYPVRDPLRANLARLQRAAHVSASGPVGFYTGAQLGVNSLDTHSSETRSSGGRDAANYGDGDYAGGLFAGYGWNWDRWYLGLELETEQSDAGWSHSKNKSDSRTSSLDKNYSYAAGLRLGRALVNNSLLYLRLGAVRSQFDGFYTINDSPQNAFDEDFSLTGLRYGVGVEFDLGEQLFARLDYSVTNYRDKTLQSADFNEHYDIHESLFNLGIGWRFNKVPTHNNKLAPDTLAGFYAGGQMGYGMTGSDLDGLHRDQGSGPYAFNADFADHGFTPGVFAGYAINWQKLLLALELEAETSSLEWEHQRDSADNGGRDFSVEVGNTLGAAIKLGYILDSGTLLYVKAGTVQTEVTTQWAKGNNRNFDIERDDDIHGLRIGLGAEVPLTQQSFIRLDFSHTNYDSYDFVTEHGGGSNSDAMRFDTTTNLFKLGLGVRF